MLCIYCLCLCARAIAHRAGVCCLFAARCILHASAPNDGENRNERRAQNNNALLLHIPRSTAVVFPVKTHARVSCVRCHPKRTSRVLVTALSLRVSSPNAVAVVECTNHYASYWRTCNADKKGYTRRNHRRADPHGVSAHIFITPYISAYCRCEIHSAVVCCRPVALCGFTQLRVSVEFARNSHARSTQKILYAV